MRDKKKLFIIAAFVVFLIIIFGNHHFRRLVIYRKNKKLLVKQLKKLRDKNAQLSRRIKEFQKNPDKAYYKIAREKYGMIEKGEIEYRFVDK